MTIRRALPWSIAAILLAAMAATWLLARPTPAPRQAQGGHSPEAGKAELSVQVQAVRKQRVGRALELSGTVKPFRTATVATRVQGRITSLSLEEGDRVSEGQVLAQVDVSAVSAQARQASAQVDVALATSNESQKAVQKAQAALASAHARVRQTEAQLQEARAAENQAIIDQKRMAFLFKGDGVARADLDRANTGLAVARARVSSLLAARSQARADMQSSRAGIEQARAAHAQTVASVDLARAGVDVAASDLSYGTLRAPFSGVVTRKMAYLGDLTSPGKPILEIQDVDRLHLEVPTPEESLRFLLPGRAVKVRVDALDRETRGEVYQVIPSADPATRSFTVKLHLPRQAGLIPGLYGKIRLYRGAREALLVPQGALVRRGQLVNVFVVAGDVAQLRLVKIGDPQEGGLVEVLSGLAAGEKVVVNPPGVLEDGGRVRVSPVGHDAQSMEDRHVQLP